MPKTKNRPKGKARKTLAGNIKTTIPAVHGTACPLSIIEGVTYANSSDLANQIAGPGV